MIGSGMQASESGSGTHLVLYDGVCGLCNRLLQFLLKHDRKAVFSFAPLQISTAEALVTRFGGNADDLTSFYVLADYRTEHVTMLNKSTAALFIAGELGWPWMIARIARVIPTAIRDAVYDLIARARYRLFGHLSACLVPRPEFRRRFIDR